MASSNGPHPKKALWRHFYNFASMTVAVANLAGAYEYFFAGTPTLSLKAAWMGFKLLTAVGQLPLHFWINGSRYGGSECLAWPKFKAIADKLVDIEDPKDFKEGVGKKCYMMLTICTPLSALSGVSDGWQMHDIVTTAIWGTVWTIRTLGKLLGKHELTFYMQYPEGKIHPNWSSDPVYNKIE